MPLRQRSARGGSVWRLKVSGHLYRVVKNVGGFVMAVREDNPNVGWASWEDDWRGEMEWVRGK